MKAIEEYAELLLLLADPQYRIRFEWTELNHLAEFVVQDKLIRINLYALIFGAAVHEGLHALHLDWTEKQVNSREYGIRKTMSRKDIKKLVELVLRRAKE